MKIEGGKETGDWTLTYHMLVHQSLEKCRDCIRRNIALFASKVVVYLSPGVYSRLSGRISEKLAAFLSPEFCRLLPPSICGCVPGGVPHQSSSPHLLSLAWATTPQTRRRNLWVIYSHLFLRSVGCPRNITRLLTLYRTPQRPL